VLAVISIFTFSMLSAWGRKFEHQAESQEEKGLDSIIAGIVLGGLLLLYLLFFWVQKELFPLITTNVD
jgi:hypothetical protein